MKPTPKQPRRRPQRAGRVMWSSANGVVISTHQNEYYCVPVLVIPLSQKALRATLLADGVPAKLLKT